MISCADVGGTISSIVESSLGCVEGSSSGVEGTLGNVEGSSGGVEGTLGNVEGTLGGVESTLGNVEGFSGSVEGTLGDLLSAPATTATDAIAPALSLHRVERQSGGSWDMDATMGAYRFRLSGSAGIAPCWVQT